MPQLAAICFGEALIDHHDDESIVAGAPLHVAVRLSSMGWSSYLLTRIGDDDAGRDILSTLSAHHVDDLLVQIDPSAATGSAVIATGAQGINRFEITHPAAWDRIEPPDTLPSHDVLYFGTLVGRDAPSRTTLFLVGGMSTARLKVCDVNLRGPWIDPQTVDWALDKATVLKCSDEELPELTSRGPAGLFDKHGQLELVAVTSGSEGATLFRRDARGVHVSAPDVAVIDTVGAGDAFTAGLIDALAHGLGDTEALRHAVTSAADAVSSPGGLPAVR